MIEGTGGKWGWGVVFGSISLEYLYLGRQWELGT